MSLLIVLALVVFALGLALLRVSAGQRRRSGLPAGQIVYEDVGMGTPHGALVSERYMLVGKPDYLIQRGGVLIPVEVKSRRAPIKPYRAHRFQLLAYCLLVEESSGHAPPYGVLRYQDREFEIAYDEKSREDLLRLLEEIRGASTAVAPLPQHDNPAKCAHCPYRDICDARMD